MTLKKSEPKRSVLLNHILYSLLCQAQDFLSIFLGCYRAQTYTPSSPESTSLPTDLTIFTGWTLFPSSQLLKRPDWSKPLYPATFNATEGCCSVIPANNRPIHPILWPVYAAWGIKNEEIRNQRSLSKKDNKDVASILADYCSHGELDSSYSGYFFADQGSILGVFWEATFILWNSGLLVWPSPSATCHVSSSDLVALVLPILQYDIQRIQVYSLRVRTIGIKHQLHTSALSKTNMTYRNALHYAEGVR